MIDISFKLLFTQFISFVIFVIILYFLLIKKLISIIEGRKKYIEKTIEEAEIGKEEANKLREKYQTELKNLEKKKEQIIKEAIAKAEAEKINILNAAKEEAKMIIQQAEKEVEKKKEEILADLKKQVAHLSILAASKLIEKKITDEDSYKFIEDFINKLDKEAFK